MRQRQMWKKLPDWHDSLHCCFFFPFSTCLIYSTYHWSACVSARYKKCQLIIFRPILIYRWSILSSLVLTYPICINSLLSQSNFWSKSSRQTVVRPLSYLEGSSQSLCSQRELKGIAESWGGNAQKEYIIVFRSDPGKEEEQRSWSAGACP